MRDRAEQAAHYRNKAEEVRVIAETMKNPEPKRFLMTVAGDYLMLALALERSFMKDPIPASE